MREVSVPGIPVINSGLSLLIRILLAFNVALLMFKFVSCRNPLGELGLPMTALASALATIQGLTLPEPAPLFAGVTNKRLPFLGPPVH
jgi:hypothetical protein